MDLPEFFGLDIGNHSIKVAQLDRRSDGKANLTHIATITAPFGMLDNDSEEGVKQLAAEIKQAVETAKISTPNCVAAMAEEPIFSRLLTIPRVEGQELEEAVHWELKPLIPVPLEEVDIAFLEISEKVVNGRKFVDIYSVASPKNLVNKFKSLTKAAGLNLIALETESLANTRTISFTYGSEQSVMICDFGAQSTDVILARKGVPVYAQTISTGSEALTKAIAADYGINEQQAEQYKRTYGIRFDAGDGKIAKSIEPILQLIVSEVSRTLTYLKQRIGETETAGIYLVGEAAALPGLPEYMTQKLGLKSILVNPFQNLMAGDSVKKRLEGMNAAGFSVAIGLGLKDN